MKSSAVFWRIALLLLLLQESACYFGHRHRFVFTQQQQQYQQLVGGGSGGAAAFALAAAASPLQEGGDGMDEDDDDTPIFAKLKKQLRGTSVYLVGMMGSGKSTVGDALAKGLGYRFMDTDAVAEFMIEMPIADFFAKGEDEVKQFRELEYSILMEMAQYTRVVLATGGGIVEKRENWSLLHHGIVVYLDLSPEDIYVRLSANPEQLAKRPLLREEDPLGKLQKLSATRRDMYMQADVKVPVPSTADPQQVAELVATQIHTFIKQNPPLWQEWKKKRDDKALEMASISNPSAVAASGLGQGKVEGGSITYVAMSDIKSGKVQLPTFTKKSSEDEPLQ